MVENAPEFLIYRFHALTSSQPVGALSLLILSQQN